MPNRVEENSWGNEVMSMEEVAWDVLLNVLIP